MLMKVVVVVMLLGILGSLASGLVFLLRDQRGSERTARALTVRITISICLFLLLLAGYGLGWITPHGIYPTPR